MTKDEIIAVIQDMPVPPHETRSDGITCRCWCLPKVALRDDGGFIFVHNELIDRTELLKKLGEESKQFLLANE